MIPYSSGAFGFQILLRAHGSAIYKTFVPALLSSTIYVLVYNFVGYVEATQYPEYTIFVHPYPMTALVAAYTFLLVFRANYSYNRWWEAYGACFTMHSKWIDFATELSAFHYQSEHYGSNDLRMKPPAFGSYPHIQTIPTSNTMPDGGYDDDCSVCHDEKQQKKQGTKNKSQKNSGQVDDVVDDGSYDRSEDFVRTNDERDPNRSSEIIPSSSSVPSSSRSNRSSKTSTVTSTRNRLSSRDSQGTVSVGTDSNSVITTTPAVPAASTRPSDGSAGIVRTPGSGMKPPLAPNSKPIQSQEGNNRPSNSLQSTTTTTANHSHRRSHTSIGTATSSDSAAGVPHNHHHHNNNHPTRPHPHHRRARTGSAGTQTKEEFIQHLNAIEAFQKQMDVQQNLQAMEDEANAVAAMSAAGKSTDTEKTITKVVGETIVAPLAAAAAASKHTQQPLPRPIMSSSPSGVTRTIHHSSPSNANSNPIPNPNPNSTTTNNMTDRTTTTTNTSRFNSIRLFRRRRQQQQQQDGSNVDTAARTSTSPIGTSSTTGRIQQHHRRRSRAGYGAAFWRRYRNTSRNSSDDDGNHSTRQGNSNNNIDPKSTDIGQGENATTMPAATQASQSETANINQQQQQQHDDDDGKPSLFSSSSHKQRQSLAYSASTTDAPPAPSYQPLNMTKSITQPGGYQQYHNRLHETLLFRDRFDIQTGKPYSIFRAVTRKHLREGGIDPDKLHTPLLFLEEVAHLLSLLSAVSFSTLRNDLPDADSPLTDFQPGLPWPHVDPDRYKAKVRQGWARSQHQSVTVLRYLMGASRTDRARTLYNAARPFRVIGNVSDQEIAALQQARGPLAKVQLVSLWLQELITREHLSGSMGKVAPPIISRLYQYISDGMVGYNAARRIAYVPFPFPHAQITTLFVFIVDLFVIPLLMLTFVTSVYIGFILNLLTVMCFTGLGETAREVEAPFQNIPNDVPLNNFQAQFNESLMIMFFGYHPDAYWLDEDEIDEMSQEEKEEERIEPNKDLRRNVDGAEGVEDLPSPTVTESMLQMTMTGTNEGNEARSLTFDDSTKPVENDEDHDHGQTFANPTSGITTPRIADDGVETENVVSSKGDHALNTHENDHQKTSLGDDAHVETGDGLKHQHSSTIFPFWSQSSFMMDSNTSNSSLIFLSEPSLEVNENGEEDNEGGGAQVSGSILSSSSRRSMLTKELGEQIASTEECVSPLDPKVLAGASSSSDAAESEQRSSDASPGLMNSTGEPKADAPEVHKGVQVHEVDSEIGNSMAL